MYKGNIREFFQNPSFQLYETLEISGDHKRTEGPYYLTQLHVLFERLVYWHWLTDRNGKVLIEEGFLKKKEEEGVIFVLRSDVRYYKRKMKQKLDLIKQYADDNVTRGYGLYAEDLFRRTLQIEGFKLLGTDTNSYDGKSWTKTDHDLDFIVEKDGIAYGAEVKNTLSYMERDEFEIKLELCDYLGLVPLWILNNAPKSQFLEMKRRGGFSLIFGTQVYPPGFRRLVKDIWEILRLPVPVNVWRTIPEKLVKIFLRQHEKRLVI
ncbi:MAG: hypothetical protein ACE5R6_18475 [Candidatus Heimdallarchaeota archaeon]